MVKLLAFIGWLVATGGALWWAYTEQQEGWVFTLIAFISTIALLSIFSLKKKNGSNITKGKEN